jgi:alpha-ribazole phosphatase
MIFLRHPRPAVAAGICYGRLDIDLHADGDAQIGEAVRQLSGVRAVIASPAKRCRALAEAIAEHCRVAPVFDERLWEMHMGDWEGMAWRDIPREVSEPWTSDPFNLPCPNGESFRDVQLRVLAALAGHSDDTAVVCHAGPIRAVQMAWLGLGFAEAFSNTPSYAEPITIVRPENTARQSTAPCRHDRRF